MHGQPSVKICTAEQAKNIHQYKNNKLKLHKTNAAIWYNKSCRMKGLTPKYISIKVSDNNKRVTQLAQTATHEITTNEGKVPDAASVI